MNGRSSGVRFMYGCCALTVTSLEIWGVSYRLTRQCYLVMWLAPNSQLWNDERLPAHVTQIRHYCIGEELLLSSFSYILPPFSPRDLDKISSVKGVKIKFTFYIHPYSPSSWGSVQCKQNFYNFSWESAIDVAKDVWKVWQKMCVKCAVLVFNQWSSIYIAV